MTDKQIRNLLVQEQRLERQLAQVRARITTARRAHADRNGLITPLRVEALRLAVSS